MRSTLIMELTHRLQQKLRAVLLPILGMIVIIKTFLFGTIDVAANVGDESFNKFMNPGAYVRRERRYKWRPCRSQSRILFLSLLLSRILSFVLLPFLYTVLHWCIWFLSDFNLVVFRFRPRTNNVGCSKFSCES